MSAISSWSTTANNNNSASPDGWPENMAPSGVNNSAREMMAQLRTWYDTMEWRAWGHTITYGSATTFTTASGDGDTTAIYLAGRRIKAVGSSTGTIYGKISGSSHSTVTTVTVVWDSGSLQNEALTISLGLDATGEPYERGWQRVEYQDLTSGSPSSVEFDHTLEAGYIYRLEIHGVSISTTGLVYIRLKNDAGTLLSSNGDYYQSAMTAAQTGIANQSADGFSPWNYSGIASQGGGQIYDMSITIRRAMDTGQYTTMMADVSMIDTTSHARCASSCHLSAIDGHNKVLVVATAGTFDAGEAYLYRIPEVRV